jgi:hypothetical protein
MLAEAERPGQREVVLAGRSVHRFHRLAQTGFESVGIRVIRGPKKSRSAETGVDAALLVYRVGGVTVSASYSTLTVYSGIAVSLKSSHEGTKKRKRKE